LADVQFIRNDFVRLTGNNEIQHFLFAFRQFVQPIADIPADSRRKSATHDPHLSRIQPEQPGSSPGCFVSIQMH